MTKVRIWNYNPRQKRKVKQEIERIMTPGFKIGMRSAFIRAKNDWKELSKSFSEFKNAQRKERKSVNVWVSAFIIIGVIPAVFLSFYMFGGAIQIVFQGANTDTVPSMSQEALTGLILISIALGGLTMWFATDSKESDRKRTTRHVGKLFLYAALALSLFMLLSPTLPYIRENTDSLSTLIKVVTLLGFMAGSILFAWATLLGLVFLWRL